MIIKYHQFIKQTLRLTSLILLVFFSNPAYTQNLTCGSDIVNQKALSENPELQIQIDQLEKFTKDFEYEGDISKSTTKIIPVVVHIIHNYGAENISKEQVLDAIRILNEDFQLLNQDQTTVIPQFQDRIANCNIEFRLAGKDPQGNCTDGITRTVSPLTFNANDNVKQLISWTTSRYLNIWVVNSIDIGISAGGYAYRPGNAPIAAFDGIVIINRQFGSIGTSIGGNFAARTLTHEVGHYLNLLHPWGPSNEPGLQSNCNVDDGVTDTPNTIGVANISCNLSQSTCGSIDNVQNFMDYSSCAIMFTNGQNTRVQAALSSPIASRNNLSSNANLVFTGTNNGFQVPCAPIADFNVNFTYACAGETLTFQDLSFNGDVTSWVWSFPGGTPSSSTQQNPVVTYNQAGLYNVSLVATNNKGSNQKIRGQIVKINPAVAVLDAPLFEGFENTSFPSFLGDANKNWIYESSGNNPFARVTNTAFTASASLKYNDALPTGSVSSFISPAFDMTKTSGPASATFKIAYARKNSESNDRLAVFVSRNCGRTWVPRFSKSGEALTTVSANFSSGFTPSGNNQWKVENINLVAFANDENLLIKFEVTDGGGNAIYFDDINISESTLNIDEVSFLKENAIIYPNPGNGNETLSFDLLSSGKTNITVYDAVGRKISSKDLGMLTMGNYQFGLSDMIQNGSKGIYFLQLEQNSQRITLKWIVQ